MKKKFQAFILAAVAAAFVVAPAQEAKAISLFGILSSTTRGQRALTAINAAFTAAANRIATSPPPVPAIGTPILTTAFGLFFQILNFNLPIGPQPPVQ